MRCASQASRSSIDLIPALTNLRTATTPIPSICFICSGLSSHTRAPRLRSNISALWMLTESPRHIWQSMMHRIRLLMFLNTICVSIWYCALCLAISPSKAMSAEPRTDWIIRETLCAGRSMLTGMEKRIDGDLLSILYSCFSPALNRSLVNSDAWAMAESFEHQVSLIDSKSDRRYSRSPKARPLSGCP